MSAQAYTLRIAIDDSKLKDLERRLQKLLGTGSGGGTTSASKPEGALGNASIAKNILKLSGIAIGVTGILSVVKKIAEMSIGASPILQSMLKLLNVGIMFILRPIGDFLGFFLRPIIVYFIRNIALPMYRTWSPIMRNLGAWLGNQVTKNLGEATQAGGKPIFQPGFEFGDLFKNLESNILGLAAFFDIFQPGQFESAKKFINDMKNIGQNLINPFLFNLSSLFTVILDGFIGLANAQILPTINNIGEFFKVLLSQFISIGNTHFLPVLNDIASFFTELLDYFIGIGTNHIMPIIDGIAGFFQIILNNLTGTIANTWSSIVNFFRQLSEQLAKLPQLIWESLTNIIGGGGNNGGSTTNNNNFMIDINSNGVSDLDEAKQGLSDFFNELLQGKR